MQALIFVTHAGDGSGRLYAVEQRGVIWPVEPDGSLHGDPFVDLTDRITAAGERGLLGLAFHPDYEENGRFFVDYTDANGDTVVAELARSGETRADPASERVILQVDQPFGNHNGGMIAFGPDGYLYVALGDGGGAGDPQGNGQDTSTLLGKILRINVDAGGEAPYGIPADNPFADGAGGRPEIWAWGLRNPWRFSFDRQTGALFIGDVGQGTTEEVDVQPAGQGGLNFGWKTMEGPDCYGSRGCDQSGLTLPVASYDRRGGGNCAVTGGYVYRGSDLVGLAGTYLFADYCSGRLWGLNVTRAESEFNLPFEQLDDLSFNVSSFGEDEAGELYVVDHGGAILRLVGRGER
jgi:glucose/arabinose dehydrogenase